MQYSRKWAGEYALHDAWKKTDGRSANEHKNLIRDFSHDRGQGDTFGFVKKMLNLSDTDTFKWFEDNFGISTETQKQPIRFLRQSLENLKTEHIEYLTTRGIDYMLVKDVVKLYRNAIACLVYKGWSPKWLRARTLSQEHNKRFFSASGYEWDWVYMHELDENKEYIIVVEWLIDFLTLRQYDSNVVGIVSAQSWYEEIKILSEKYRIVLIPDNDDAWYQWLQQMKGVPYSLFSLQKFGEYKDINDMYMWLNAGSQIIEAILEDARDILPITPIFDGLDVMLQTIKSQWKLGIDWPLREIYNHCQWVIKGKVYTIWAYSNVGKSKFAYFHAQYFLKKWLRVLFINLEVSAEFCLAEIINSYYETTWKQQWNWYGVDRSRFRNLIIRDDLFELSEIITEIETSKCDICFIDFVQNIQVKNTNGYEKNSATAIGIQRTAIKTWTTIFNLSQIANSMAKDINSWTGTVISLKGAWEYYASSDVIFILKRGMDDWVIDLVIEKNKFWRNKIESSMFVDFEKNQFKFIEPSKGI